MQLLQLIAWPIGLLITVGWGGLAFRFYKEHKGFAMATCLTLMILSLIILELVLEVFARGC